MSDEAIVSYLKSYQRRLNIINIVMLICFISVPFSFFMTFVKMERGQGMMIPMLISIVACSVIVPLGRKQKAVTKERKSFIGDYIVKPILTKRIEVKNYSPNKFVSREIAKNSNILPNFDEISGSDYVEGIYRGVNIFFSDLTLVRVEKHRDSNGRTRTTRTVVFKGHFLRMSLSKIIDGYVRIRERKNQRKKGFFSELINSTADLLGVNSNTVEVESEAFNNQFEIKTNDDELAFYILTPQFMENVIKADELAEGYTNIEFMGNHVDMSLNNNADSFEITKRVLGVEDLRKIRFSMKRDLDIMLAIADEILAKERIFE